MPELDTPAQAALEGATAPAFFLFLDLAGDDGPLRVTTYGQDAEFAATGDGDLDGQTFTAFGGKAIEISDVGNSDSGSDTLTIKLSGIVSMDASLVADIGNKALWQGRLCRLWFQLYDDTGDTPQGAIVAYYTGYMSSVLVDGEPRSQVLTVSIENYLAFFSAASNRSYLNQKDYDPADQSAAATIACSNGLRRNSGATGGGARPPSTAGSSSFINSYAPYGGALDQSGIAGAQMSFR